MVVAHLSISGDLTWRGVTATRREATTLSRISGYSWSWRTRDAVWINLIEEMRVLAKAPPPLLITTTPRALIGRAARCCRIVRPRRLTFALSHPTTSSAPLPLELFYRVLYSQKRGLNLTLEKERTRMHHTSLMRLNVRVCKELILISWTAVPFTIELFINL